MSKPAWSVTARTGPVRRHKRQAFFACEGLVALCDERSGEEDYTVLLPSECVERANALDEFARKVKAGDSKWQREEARVMRKAAQDLETTAKEARHMGDPSDPAVQAYWAKHRDRKSKVSFSQATLPDVSLGKFTGRTADVDGKAHNVAADVHLKLRRPARRKPRTTKGIILDI